MKTSFKELFADNINLVSFWASVFFFAVVLIVVALTYSHLPPFLPIYNKLAWGYARLGHTYEIFVPVVIPFILCAANIFLAKKVYSKFPLLARFLFLTTLLLSLFTCIFIIKLTLIIL